MDYSSKQPISHAVILRHPKAQESTWSEAYKKAHNKLTQMSRFGHEGSNAAATDLRDGTKMASFAACLHQNGAQGNIMLL